MANFTYEGMDDNTSIYTFKAVDPPSKLLADVPFNITADDYDSAVIKLKKFIRDAEVVDSKG